MKKSDIAMIILIASVSVMVAYFVANSLFHNVTSDSVQVDTIDEIKADITPPDPRIFNTNAINPSVEVQIGSDTSETP